MIEQRIDSKETVKIGRISYINVAPVYYGLDRQIKPSWLDMVTAPPAVLNTMLERGEIVMSPVSSAAYAKNHDQWLLMPDVSISSFGNVMSVILASRYPMDQLHGKRVLFTEESATAAALVRYFFAIRNIQPVIDTRKIIDVETIPHDVDAALVIGDTALTQNWPGCYPYVFDLGELWHSLTGLPFVFAVWAIRKDFVNAYPETVEALKSLFRQSKCMGEEKIDEIVQNASLKTGLMKDVCRDYFRHLDCGFGPLHKQGLTRFFNGLHSFGLIREKVILQSA